VFRTINIFLLLLIVGNPLQGLAEDPPSAEERLEALYSEIENQNDSLIKLNYAMKEVELVLIKLRKEHRVLQQEEDRLKAELAKLFKAWQSSNKKISEIEGEIISIRERSLERVRNIYMSQNDQVKTHLISTGRHDNISELLYLLGKVEKFDRSTVIKLSTLVKAQRVEEAKYSKLMKEQQEIKNKVVAKGDEIKRNLAENDAVKGKLQKREAEVESVVVKLRANALRLETIVASLTEGDIQQVNKQEKREIEEARAQLSPRFVPFEGPGLKKGEVSRPVNGRVVRGFGKFHHSEFKDLIFNKGNLFSAPVNAPIKAVAKGQVVFAGRMPGYGSMIIVDHGNRTHTLYAKLDDIRVRLKQLVDKGEVIGEADKVEGEKGNFYFEIRKAGKPVNPAEFIR